MKTSTLTGFRKIVGMIGCVWVILLTGCQVDTSTDLYQNIQKQTSQFSTNAEQKKQDSVVYITELSYSIANSCKRYAPFVGVISVALGALLLHLISEDQAMRKKVWVLFIFGIPGLSILLGFGLPWLVGAML